MLNKEKEKIVLKDQPDDSVYRDTVNNEMHEFEDYVEFEWREEFEEQDEDDDL